MKTDIQERPMPLSKTRSRRAERARRRALAGGACLGALLLLACTHNRTEPTTTPPPTPPAAAAGACSQELEAVQKSLAELESAGAQDYQEELELSRLLSSAARSPELQALLRCLSKP